jgi:hypothetical protein
MQKEGIRRIGLYSRYWNQEELECLVHELRQRNSKWKANAAAVNGCKPCSQP